MRSVPLLLDPLSEIEYHTRRTGPQLGSLELESATEVELHLKMRMFQATTQFKRRP